MLYDTIPDIICRLGRIMTEIRACGTCIYAVSWFRRGDVDLGSLPRNAKVILGHSPQIKFVQRDVLPVKMGLLCEIQALV